MPAPDTSREMCLSWIRINGGVTYKQILDYVFEEKLYFGPEKDILSVLLDLEEDKYIAFQEEERLYILAD